MLELIGPVQVTREGKRDLAERLALIVSYQPKIAAARRPHADDDDGEIRMRAPRRRVRR